MPVLHTKPAPRGVGRGEGRGRRKRSGLQRHGPTSPPARVWDTGPPPSIDHGPPAVSSTVSSTVNSQSTHSQLNSQLTVNSQSTQRSTGPQNPGVLLRILENSGHQDHQKTLFNLIKIIKRGRSSHPSSLSRQMTTPFSTRPNRIPGLGGPGVR